MFFGLANPLFWYSCNDNNFALEYVISHTAREEELKGDEDMVSV